MRSAITPGSINQGALNAIQSKPKATGTIAPVPTMNYGMASPGASTPSMTMQAPGGYGPSVMSQNQSPTPYGSQPSAGGYPNSGGANGISLPGGKTGAGPTTGIGATVMPGGSTSGSTNSGGANGYVLPGFGTGAGPGNGSTPGSGIGAGTGYTPGGSGAGSGANPGAIAGLFPNETRSPGPGSTYPTSGTSGGYPNGGGSNGYTFPGANMGSGSSAGSSGGGSAYGGGSTGTSNPGAIAGLYGGAAGGSQQQSSPYGGSSQMGSQPSSNPYSPQALQSQQPQVQGQQQQQPAVQPGQGQQQIDPVTGRPSQGIISQWQQQADSMGGQITGWSVNQQTGQMEPVISRNGSVISGTTGSNGSSVQYSFGDNLVPETRNGITKSKGEWRQQENASSAQRAWDNSNNENRARMQDPTSQEAFLADKAERAKFPEGREGDIAYTQWRSQQINPKQGQSGPGNDTVTSNWQKQKFANYQQGQSTGNARNQFTQQPSTGGGISAAVEPQAQQPSSGPATQGPQDMGRPAAGSYSDKFSPSSEELLAKYGQAPSNRPVLQDLWGNVPDANWSTQGPRDMGPPPQSQPAAQAAWTPGQAEPTADEIRIASGTMPGQVGGAAQRAVMDKVQAWNDWRQSQVKAGSGVVNQNSPYATYSGDPTLKNDGGDMNFSGTPTQVTGTKFNNVVNPVPGGYSVGMPGETPTSNRAPSKSPTAGKGNSPNAKAPRASTGQPSAPSVPGGEIKPAVMPDAGPTTQGPQDMPNGGSASQNWQQGGNFYGIPYGQGDVNWTDKIAGTSGALGSNVQQAPQTNNPPYGPGQSGTIVNPDGTGVAWNLGGAQNNEAILTQAQQEAARQGIPWTDNYGSGSGSNGSSGTTTGSLAPSTGASGGGTTLGPATGGSSDQGSPMTGLAIPDAYQKAYEEARKANEDRYNQINAGYEENYGNAMDWQGRSANNLINQFDERYTRNMDTAAGLGAQELKDIEDRFIAERGSAEAGLIDRGLGNTTIRPSVMGGITRNESDAMGGALDRINRLKLQTDMALSGDSLANQQGLHGERLGLMTEMPQRQLDFMERRTDSYPDLNQLLQLGQMYGQAEGQTGGTNPVMYPPNINNGEGLQNPYMPTTGGGGGSIGGGGGGGNSGGSGGSGSSPGAGSPPFSVTGPGSPVTGTYPGYPTVGGGSSPASNPGTTPVQDPYGGENPYAGSSPPVTGGFTDPNPQPVTEGIPSGADLVNHAMDPNSYGSNQPIMYSPSAVAMQEYANPVTGSAMAAGATYPPGADVNKTAEQNKEDLINDYMSKHKMSREEAEFYVNKYYGQAGGGGTYYPGSGGGLAPNQETIVR